MNQFQETQSQESKVSAAGKIYGRIVIWWFTALIASQLFFSLNPPLILTIMTISLPILIICEVIIKVVWLKKSRRAFITGLLLLSGGSFLMIATIIKDAIASMPISLSHGLYIVNGIALVVIHLRTVRENWPNPEPKDIPSGREDLYEPF